MLTAIVLFSSVAYASGVNTIKRNVLSKPGECWDHEAWPRTIQCALTKKCLPIEAFRNKTNDCCGFGGRNYCPDKSDEDRIDPPGDCKGHPHFEFNMTIQCAKTKRCLSRLTQPNGLCECCGDGYDCDTCDDHSDEDPCQADEWLEKRVKGRLVRSEKFSCQGTCRDILQFEDGKIDCPFECVEPDTRPECETALISTLTDNSKRWCEMLSSKRTNFIVCKYPVSSVLIDTCLMGSRIRDGKRDCHDGIDEDSGLHPDCTEAEKERVCSPKATSCVRITNNPKMIECHCPKQHSNCMKMKLYRDRRQKDRDL